MNRTVSLCPACAAAELSRSRLGGCGQAERPAASCPVAQLDTPKQQHLRATLAQEWGLNQQEWTRYQTLMQGPQGVYSTWHDPLTALGIEARSAEERRRYADLQVPGPERRRVEKVSAYSAHTTKPSPALSRRGGSSASPKAARPTRRARAEHEASVAEEQRAPGLVCPGQLHRATIQRVRGTCNRRTRSSISTSSVAENDARACAALGNPRRHGRPEEGSQQADHAQS